MPTCERCTQPVDTWDICEAGLCEQCCEDECICNDHEEERE
jgi:hypothetical protein